VWGDKVEWFKSVAKETGEVPRALAQRPEVPQHLAMVWSAFFLLSGDRSIGFEGPGPIPFLAIDRYAERFGLTGDADEFERFVELIRAMDAEYRKPPPKTESATPPDV